MNRIHIRTSWTINTTETSQGQVLQKGDAKPRSTMTRTDQRSNHPTSSP